MNRLIKFRGWDKEKRVMDYHDGLVRFGMSLNDFEQSRRYEFMQFTDLLDKNGKEIYEGDFLSVDCDCDHPCDGHPQIISFRDACFWVGEETLFSEYSTHSKRAFGQVIGNIYENEDLLK